MADDQFQADQLRDHAFDGIQEYDNDLPMWWQMIFYLSIVFAVVYIGYYHFGPGQLGAAALRSELAQAEVDRQNRLLAMGELTEEDLRSFLGDSTRISAGNDLYESQGCAACHNADGLGSTGPNLRDDYWKYGSNMLDIFHSLQDGRGVLPDGGLQMPKQNITRDQLINLTVFLVERNKREKANGRGRRIEGEILAPIEY